MRAKIKLKVIVEGDDEPHQASWTMDTDALESAKSLRTKIEKAIEEAIDWENR